MRLLWSHILALGIVNIFISLIIFKIMKFLNNFLVSFRIFEDIQSSANVCQRRPGRQCLKCYDEWGKQLVFILDDADTMSASSRTIRWLWGIYADYELLSLLSSITKLRTFPPERLIEAIRETVKFIYLGLKWSLLEQTKRGSKSRENIPLTLTSWDWPNSYTHFDDFMFNNYTWKVKTLPKLP